MTANAVQTARTYYNSDDADAFYQAVWGGEDIHVGIYASDDEPIRAASRRTVDKMVSMLPRRGAEVRILDIGSGYGGAARHLALHHAASVTGINLSEVENQRARRLNREAGLQHRINIHDGSFESLPFEDRSFDVVWSQDAILHSERRAQVLQEAFRVLRSPGHLIFTDPMQSNDCPPGVLEPILSRIHLESLGSEAFYRTAGTQAGFDFLRFDDMSHELTHHYRRILEETEAKETELTGSVSTNYLQRMKAGLQHWIDGGRAGYLAWGIFLFRKP